MIRPDRVAAVFRYLAECAEKALPGDEVEFHIDASTPQVRFEIIGWSRAINPDELSAIGGE